MLNRMRDMNYTTTELATLLHELCIRIAQGTPYSWISRRQLRARGWKHNGRITDTWIHRNEPPVYRLGDVLELVRSSTG